MTARVVSFLRRAIPRDWSPQELAEFYRVEAILAKAGLSVSSDRGITDEGDPWFVFCRSEDEDVIVHFARIGGQYLISAPSYGDDVRGYDFRELVRSLVERQPLIRPIRRTDNLAFHPSALLVMLVAAVLVKSGHAAEAASSRPTDSPVVGAERLTGRPDVDDADHLLGMVSVETQQDTSVLMWIAAVSRSLDNPVVPTAAIFSTAFWMSGHESLSLATALSPSSFSFAHDSGQVVLQPPHSSGVPIDDATHTSVMAAVQTHMVSASSGVSVFGDVARLPKPIEAYIQVAAQPVMSLPAGSAIPTNDHSVRQDVAESLLSGLGGNVTVLHLDALPAAFVAPLQASVHSEAKVVVSAPAGGPAAALPLVTTAETHSSTSASAGSGAAAEPVVTQSVTPTSGIPTPGPNAPSLSVVMTIMQNFAAEVGSHLAVLVTGNQVIEYDYYAIDHTPAMVSAVTYDFTDGSHVSLVGLPSELSHARV